ncbi:MAG: fibronectin type III domain-containing protein, partial [Candidatus Magasanikiibacteriota bacterium]
MKSITNAGSAVLKTSSHDGELASYFEGTADAANLIQSLRSDGFQVGTGANVNTSAITYFWFAFKTGNNFKVGSYTGTTLAHDETIETGFQSNLIWTKPATAVGGITKPSTLAGTTSQYFLATANATTQITGITEDGFSVGIGTGANAATTIRYMAWRVPYYEPPANLPGDPGTPAFSNTSITGTVVSWTAASGADYYIVERASDRSGTPGLYKYVATTSALSIADNMLNANQTYWYRVRASNPNGYSGYSGVNSVTTNSQTLQIQTGSYVGTGNQFSISGLGFAPEMVILKSDTATIPTIFKTSVMRDNVMGFFSATADGAVANINIENVTYTWIAFAGSDCSSTGYFCLGAYTGTGAAQSISTGFQPDYVSVKNNEAVLANYKTTALGANNHTIFYINIVKNTTGAYISSLNTDGFSVGTTNSVAGGTFFYFAFKEKTNFFKQGYYAGNSSD